MPKTYDEKKSKNTATIPTTTLHYQLLAAQQQETDRTKWQKMGILDTEDGALQQ